MSMFANFPKAGASYAEMRRLIAVLLFAAAAVVVPARAADEPLRIQRATGPITVDGDLSDAAWKDALAFNTWFETNPGDNVEPKQKTVGWITYDDHFFYCAIHAFDADPSSVRAQLGDHDGISGNSDDFVGVLLDTRNDGKTALELFANAAGTQFDAVLDDSTGNEDASPDIFWDSAVKKTADGWTFEMRVPFSQLRYEQRNPQVWGVMLYRNVPRERRYQYFTHRLPRGSNCFVCNYNKVSGFDNLPTGGHYVAAPYVTGKESGTLRGGTGPDNRELVNRPVGGNAGLDVKYTPNEHTAIDATINPDFSQIESDVAQISTNQRFAINFPEKRPFFLERVELLSTPIQAVYTRTITAPRFGLRSTGNFGKDSYTILIAQDRGGGGVIIPGALGSGFAFQDFSSTDAVARWRHDIGKTSFVSVLATDKEIGGGAHNRVLGPDFQWKPDDNNTVTGQFLYSNSKTPNLPGVEATWDARSLSSFGSDLWWQFTNARWDWYTEGKDFGDDFRADLGFVPQVGYRSNYAEGGRTYRPKGFFNRVRVFAMGEYDSKQDGSMLYRLRSGGFGADGKFRSFIRFRWADEAFRVEDPQLPGGAKVLPRKQLLYSVQFAVSRRIPQVSFDGFVGQDIDFFNNRVGHGARINMTAQFRVTPKLQISTTDRLQWIRENRTNDVVAGGPDISGRLFTAQVERLRAQYMFSPQMFVRAVVQNQRTSFNPEVFGFEGLQRRSGNLSSQFLFAYKVNWQSVLYVGYGDIRDVVEDQIPTDDPRTRNDVRRDLLLSNRQFFFKVSYAIQR